jgi:hypothetical protein
VCGRERDRQKTTHAKRPGRHIKRESDCRFFLGLDRSFFSEVLVNFFSSLQSA